jgi:DNA (cytosine-5)-methyltransferase 1
VTPTIGELFAGYGGLGMGVQAALGGELAWVSDLTHTASGRRTGPGRILDHRFPDVPNLGDITAIDWTAVPRVNILTGGSPCPDISNAGAMAGMVEGTRSNLWVAMRAAIDQLEPDLVVWENVGGALNAQAASELEPCPGCMGGGPRSHLRALGRVLGDLASLGFDAEWVCIRAADVGAPHKRLRIFVVAWPSTAHAEGIRWATWRGRPDHAGARGFAPGRVGLPVDLLPTPMANEAAKATMTMTATQRLATGRRPYLTHTIADLLPTPAVNDMGDNKTVEWWDAWTAGLAEKHGNSNGHGKSLAIEAKRLDGTGSWGPYEAAVRRWEALTRPAPTPVERGTKGNLRLAARFTEWMMGLPDGWVTDVPELTRPQAIEALGNGVVPQQAFLAIETMRGRLLS